jgi:hypothetical protein
MCTEPGKAVIAIPCSDLQTFFGSDEKKAGVTYLGPFCVNSFAVMNAVCALDPTLVCRAPGVAIHRTGRRIAAMVHRRRLAQESVVRATILSSGHHAMPDVSNYERLRMERRGCPQRPRFARPPLPADAGRGEDASGAYLAVDGPAQARRRNPCRGGIGAVLQMSINYDVSVCLSALNLPRVSC